MGVFLVSEAGRERERFIRDLRTRRKSRAFANGVGSDDGEKYEYDVRCLSSMV